MSATADPTKILDSIIYYYTCQLFHPPRLLSLMSGNILRLRDQVYRTTSNEFKRQKKLAKVIERKRRNTEKFAGKLLPSIKNLIRVMLWTINLFGSRKRHRPLADVVGNSLRCNGRKMMSCKLIRRNFHLQMHVVYTVGEVR
ncbi:hypothetical protein OUZ56_008044 [Daphnia magna]|uniref:Uncharacterized protein n=1 Tax=Daphnia magna TaxID=35525 RepID=A0ABR0AC77_9CRUS|nr:hypothetical protein OUZ56_008044 [Daphnia magna]